MILSPEVWSLVEKHCEGELLESGFVRLSHIVGHVATHLPEEEPYESQRVPMAVHLLKRYGTNISVRTCYMVKKIITSNYIGNCYLPLP